eukprot:jgi/Picsp_1/2066/NSC_05531-R1_ef-hand domain-containing protein 1
MGLEEPLRIQEPLCAAKSGLRYPNLPGYLVQPERDYDNAPAFRPQTLVQEGAFSIVKCAPGQRQNGRDVDIQELRAMLEEDRDKDDGKTISQPYVPDWVKYRGMVLCFFAYYKMINVENPLGGSHYVKVKLLYFLEDGTFQVIYDSTELKGKTYMNRMKLDLLNSKAPKDLQINPWAFDIGNSIQILGRSFQIIDTDTFTRNFIKDQGRLLMPAQDMPQETDHGIGKPDIRDNCGSKISRYLLGIPVSSGHSNEKKNSSVLRVYGFVNSDIHKYFKIHFFMEDDTLEIFEILPGSRNKTRKHLSRKAYQKLGENPIQPNERPVDHGPRDLLVGKTLSIREESFLIYKADRFTIDWFKNNLNVDPRDLEEIKLDHEEILNKPPLQEIPPHNGFGDPQDSLLNCKKLVLDRSIPTKPTRTHEVPLDVEKLQFLAKFHPADGKQLQKVDSVRCFRLYVYPEDGTVAIYENKTENSGLPSGKFLERQPIFKDLRMRQDPLSVQDFWIGRIIKIYNRTFKIMDADQSTLRYFERHPDRFCMTDAREAVTQLKQVLHHGTYLDAKCEDNTEPKGRIPTLDMLQQCLPGFTRHQLLNACRAIIKQPEEKIA